MVKNKSATRFSLLLQAVLSQPTAPFRETWTRRACEDFCKVQKLKHYIDRDGNLWVGAASDREVKQASAVFVAHLDHPGVVIESFTIAKNRRVHAHGKWLGGGPMDIRNWKFTLFSTEELGTRFSAKVVSFTKGVRGPDAVTLEIEPSLRAELLPLSPASQMNWGACPDYKEAPNGVVTHRDGRVVTKAADDLVGVCALLEGLARAKKSNGAVVLLSRGEESGFHGALAVLERGLLSPTRTVMVSIETSAQLPGARIEGGPVVRLGDRATNFAPAVVDWIARSAEEAAKNKKSGFKFQRKLMDGGSCEASAFNCYGFDVGGISTPLVNYHNVAQDTITGKLRSLRPVAEEVRFGDVEKLAELLALVFESVPVNTNAAKRAKLTFPEWLRTQAFTTFRSRIVANHKEHLKYF